MKLKFIIVKLFRLILNLDWNFSILRIIYIKLWAKIQLGQG